MTNRPAKDSRGLSKLPNFGKPGGATSTGYCFEETVSAQVLEKARGIDKKVLGFGWKRNSDTARFYCGWRSG